MAGGSPSKAKRGKRRWIGLAVPPHIADRSDLTKSLESIQGLPGGWRLFDFEPADGKQFGQAVICVKLESYAMSKEVLTGAEDGSSIETIRSLTSSGKITLVRQRLGLERPPRPRRT